MNFRVCVIYRTTAVFVRGFSTPVDFVQASQLAEWLRRQYPVVAIVPGSVRPTCSDVLIDAEHELKRRETFNVDSLCDHLSAASAAHSLTSKAFASFVDEGANHIRKCAAEQLAAARPNRVLQIFSAN